MKSATRLRWLLPIAASLGLVAAACGGTGSNADRKAAALAHPTTRPDFVDHGSLPVYSCEADKPSNGITTSIVEDWELSAGAGWYTNNDRCESCQQATNTINGSIDAGQERDPIARDAGLRARDACAADCIAAQIPSYFAKPVPADKISGGRCGSQYAFHVISGPFTKWGGQLGMNLNPPKCVTSDCPPDSAPVEGGPYDGVSFWARVVPPSGAPIRLQIAESHTDNKYPETGDAGPPCQNFAFVSAQNLGLGCDTFGTFVDLTQNWQFIMLPFEEMRQEGWGKRAPFFDIRHISNITFFYGPGSWDIWIDDIAFYKRGPQ